MDLAATQIVEELDQAVDTTRVSPWDPLWALITVVVGIVLARMARGAVRRYGRRAGLTSNVIDLLGTTAMWVIVTIGVVLALTFIGLDVTPLWLLIVFVLVAFAIGGRSLLEAFGAGILLQSRAPFRPGDLVTLGEETGTVQEINSRTTVLDTPDGRRIYLPNTEVLAGQITNMSRHGQRMSFVLLDVTYGTDLDEARTVAVASLAGLSEVAADPPPVAEVTSFEASAVRVRLRFWHAPDRLSEWRAVDVVSRAAYAAYEAAGIEFAFPQQTLWWGDRPDPPSPSEG